MSRDTSTRSSPRIYVAMQALTAAAVLLALYHLVTGHPAEAGTPALLALAVLAINRRGR